MDLGVFDIMYNLLCSHKLGILGFITHNFAFVHVYMHKKCDSLLYYLPHEVLFMCFDDYCCF